MVLFFNCIVFSGIIKLFLPYIDGYIHTTACYVRNRAFDSRPDLRFSPHFPPCAQSWGDVWPLTPLDNGIISRLGWAREQGWGHRPGAMFLEMPARPRLWNNPAAPLTTVPITAASHHTQTVGHGGRWINIPTLSPLVEGSREHAGPTGGYGRPPLALRLGECGNHRGSIMWVISEKWFVKGKMDLRSRGCLRIVSHIVTVVVNESVLEYWYTAVW